MAQATALSLKGEVFVSRVGCVDSRMGNSDSAGARCFGEKGSRGPGGFKVITDAINGVFFIEN